MSSSCCFVLGLSARECVDECETFAADAEWVTRDLKRLKELLETE
jgi:hypothetical protein